MVLNFNGYALGQIGDHTCKYLQIYTILIITYNVRYVFVVFKAQIFALNDF